MLYKIFEAVIQKKFGLCYGLWSSAIDFSSTGHHLFSLTCFDTTRLISYKWINKNMYFFLLQIGSCLSISSMPALVSSRLWFTFRASRCGYRHSREWVVGMTLETTELWVQILQFRRIIQSKGSSFPALIHFPLSRNGCTLCKMKSVNGELVDFQKSQNLIFWSP